VVAVWRERASTLVWIMPVGPESVATMNERWVYTLGRVCAVLTKPLFLFLANNYLSPDSAQAIAATFLATTLMLMAIGADPHRWFYTRRFGTNPQPSAISFYVYVCSVSLLAVLGSLGVVGIVLSATASSLLAGLAMLYFLSEKLADESLRLLLFERRFGAWGTAMIARITLQFGGLATTLAVISGSISSSAAVLALIFGNVVVFLPRVPRGVWRVIGGGSVSRLSWLIRRSVRSLAQHWRLWATALITGSVGYLDRIVALAVDPALLPVFVLVIMCFSIVQMAVDFYFVSTHRREFLQGEITLRKAVTHPELITSMIVGVVVSALACALVLRLSHNGGEFPLTYVAGIAVFQIAIAVALIPQMIVYWSKRFDWVLRTEGVFWAVLLVSAFLFGGVTGDPTRLIGLTALLTFGRVVAYCVLSLRVTHL
jgi:hypothetical protein